MVMAEEKNDPVIPWHHTCNYVCQDVTFTYPLLWGDIAVKNIASAQTGLMQERAAELPQQLLPSVHIPHEMAGGVSAKEERLV